MLINLKVFWEKTVVTTQRQHESSCFFGMSLRRFINQFIMRQNDKVCHRVPVKSEKELQCFKRRQQRRIQGVARIVLGKLEGSEQLIWMQELHNENLARIKEFSAGQRGLWYARTIVTACCGLASYYGYFMINQNMVFFNNQRDVFVWINTDLFDNHVKIYLPHNHDGELAMIRSIISFLKLWLKYDYALLSDVKHLSELASRFDHPKRPQGFKPRSPGRGEFLGGRTNSVNLQSSQMPMRLGQRMPFHGQQLLMQNRSTKDVCRSPNRDSQLNFCASSISNKPGMKFNQLTAQTEKGSPEFQHRTFNSNNNITPMTKSIGMNSNSNYFPNKTTSNKHHIVHLINKLDSNSGEYVKNKLLLDDEHMKDLQRDKLKKMKESLDGIGEELNDLFVSNVENQEEDPQVKKQIQQQFENLLG